jgi:hypothetical protein
MQDGFFSLYNRALEISNEISLYLAVEYSNVSMRYETLFLPLSSLQTLKSRERK